MKKYLPQKIESKWQRFWQKQKLYETADLGNPSFGSAGRRNYMLLAEFPYTSGNLHMGHWFTYSIADIYARYLRMNGKNVMYPIGFDAFGLPAENAAIKNNSTPDAWTKQNIRNMTKQLKSIGATFDWPRVVDTSDPDYYKWTQWIFLKLYEKGLAYRGETMVNWCPKDKTVLANEQVVTLSTSSGQVGYCDRCDTPVEQRKLTQWMFKITSFADALADDLKNLDWPEDTKAAQVNWIGRSEGALIKFLISNFEFLNKSKIQNPKYSNQNLVEVFTTRPDTLFGATYLVLAPEHGLIENLKLKIENLDEVREYIEKAKRKTELQRMRGAGDPSAHEATEVQGKTGVELKGVKAVNPANKEEIPIWIADHVLGGYGTGAIMAVPAHDERDFEFAKKFNLPIKPVVLKNTGRSYSYVMGVNEEDLKKIGIEVVEKTKDGFFKIKIPFENLELYKEFIRQHMKPHFWNEFTILGGFYFIFKHEDGRLEELELNEKTNDIIDKYGATFNDQQLNKKPANVYSWLAENSFYKEILIHQDLGVLVNSGKFSGMDSEKAKWEITKFVGGERKTQYRLRDWILSRQRYWGAPIPMIRCSKCGYQPVPETELPVKLPKLADFLPVEGGKSPLARAEKWVKAKCPNCGGQAERETDTMDTFVDSSWYFIRYTDPKNSKQLADKKQISKWLPAPMYIGGREHNTMHLLYARFIAKALNNLGAADFSEPFLSRRNHGVIMGPDGKRMSKSRGNVVDPDAEVAKYGVDTVRMNFAFLGPFEQDYAWNPKNISGISRFLNRVWNLFQKVANSKQSLSEDRGSSTKSGQVVREGNEELNIIVNKAIKKIGEDIENLKFNTAVSELMKLLNEFESKTSSLLTTHYLLLAKLLAPFAPHIAEELWMNVLGNKKSIHLETWPDYDETLLAEETATVAIQINGRVRDTVEVKKGLTEDDIKKLVLGREKIKEHVGGKEIKKIIHIQDRLVNVVTD